MPETGKVRTVKYGIASPVAVVLLGAVLVAIVAVGVTSMWVAEGRRHAKTFADWHLSQIKNMTKDEQLHDAHDRIKGLTEQNGRVNRQRLVAEALARRLEDEARTASRRTGR